MNRIFVAALKEETPNLDFFHYTGVGKINATYNLTKIINKYNPKEIINFGTAGATNKGLDGICLLYTSPSPRDGLLSRMPSSA